MNLHGVQFDIAWEDPAASFSRVDSLLRESSPLTPGDLVVLPEMFSTGFSMQVESVEEGTAKPGESFLRRMASEYGVIALGGVARRDAGGKGRNEAVAFASQGEELVRYTKIHPFSYGGESASYVAGREVALFDWAGFRVSRLICYDLRFPEVFRRAVLHGANLFLVIANWPVARAAHWRALLIARAIENQACVLGVNRCGRDPRLEYGGGSLFIDARGEVIAEAGASPTILSQAPSLSDLQKYRAKFPALADLRPEFLGS